MTNRKSSKPSQRTLSPEWFRDLQTITITTVKQRGPRNRAQPCILLHGHWLREAGFSVDQEIEVFVFTNTLVINTA